MKSGKLNVENLVIYGEGHLEVDPYFLFIEPLQWNKEKHNGHVKSHLHSSLFQISIIDGGMIFFKSDTVKKIISEPTIILIPEDHLHSFKFEQPTNGWTVTLSQNILDEILKQHPTAFSDFSSVRLIENLENDHLYKSITDLCEQMQREKSDNGLNNWIFNHSIVGLILYYINKLCEKENTESSYKKESKEYIHLRKFKKLIREKIDARVKVKDYAAQLNITTTHLNRLCNSLTGVSASQTIYNNIILESKKYLEYSTFTVSEIAYILNFKSPSHFSNFFKNQTGLSPKLYRTEDVEV